MAILRTLRTFSSGIASFSASSSGVGSRPISCSIWRRGAHDLVDRLDHVHRDADGARLVGDRAGDRLPDPPRGVGREFVAAAVLELVDRLHQADVAFLDEVEELQAAVGVFLGDRDHEAQIRLDHLLLRLARLALALLHGMHDAAELADLEARSRRRGAESRRGSPSTMPRSSCDEIGPAASFRAADAAEPVRVELVAVIFVEEVLAVDAIALGEAEQAALIAEQPLVDVVQRLDQASMRLVLSESDLISATISSLSTL